MARALLTRDEILRPHDCPGKSILHSQGKTGKNMEETQTDEKKLHTQLPPQIVPVVIEVGKPLNENTATIRIELNINLKIDK